MKLSARRSESSFYESFSDLIFGTLIIFIVVVMGLVLRLAAAEASASPSSDARSAARQMIHGNRFAGAVGKPMYYIAYVPIRGRAHIAWLPASIGDSENLTRAETDPHEGLINDPLLELCKVAQQPEALQFTPVEDFLRMQSDVTRSLIERSFVSHELAIVIYLILKAREVLGPEVDGWSSKKLRDAVGGLALYDECTGRLSPSIHPKLRPFVDEWRRWNDAGKNGNRMYEGDVELMDRLPDNGDPPLVRFVATDDRMIKIGECLMNAAQFRAMLRAIRPGRGFYLEYGSDPRVEVPAWVISDVLAPVGFDARILTADAQRLVNG